MKILLTGCAGFIGSHLTEKLLEQNHTVIGIDNFDNFYDPKFKWENLQPIFENYARNFSLIKDSIFKVQYEKLDFDVVVHLAAVLGVRNSISDPLNTLVNNVDATAHLLQNTAKRAQKFIFASSSSVYGNNQVPFSVEDKVDNPISPYAASKKAGELLCYTYHQLYNLSVTCLRFFTVYGPKQRPDLAISKFMNALYKNEQIDLFGNGQTSRDYTFVDDIVNGILAAIDRCKGYSIFNLGNDSPTKLIDLVSTIAKITDCSNPKINFTSKQAGDVESTWADISQSKKLLGYDPKIALIDGLRRQFEWLKSSKTRL